MLFYLTQLLLNKCFWCSTFIALNVGSSFPEAHVRHTQFVSLVQSAGPKTITPRQTFPECINISLMTRWIISSRVCLQRRGAIMSVFGINGVCGGQAQLIGADWRGCWAYPWTHLRQKEARQWEYMNERSRMSQLLCGNWWSGVDRLKETEIFGRPRLQ